MDSVFFFLLEKGKRENVNEEANIFFSVVSCIICFANVMQRERGIKGGMMQLANTKEKEEKEKKKVKDTNTVRLKGTCLKVGNQLAQDRMIQKIDIEESRISA